ncbi:ocs element-binding factor 1-like [Pyrus ussuriensis x Pyrus communis]|uniref:Ocs element-binding factor 1-like n=1 Tax=Pyrus ussuriensis x Pyrus communis TaxID=2448454 RepID=A0A5N5GL70_9ROSA|nr:bZIP transcription factor 53-like [Pyrus x bretschneideri]KAB2616316.1 ocs element-binding factor 1-like [Pyrus ussuriensis x Pyrus communis]
MSLVQRQSSSGSDGSATVDEKKRKRMLSNRESARRSRMKKQKQIDDLTTEITRLEMSNNQVRQTVDARERSYNEIESANNVLRAQAMELTDRLQSLNSVLHIFEEVSGFSVDIPEMHDPLLKPWQRPYPSQPIPASSGMFFI